MDYREVDGLSKRNIEGARNENQLKKDKNNENQQTQWRNENNQFGRMATMGGKIEQIE